MKINKKNPLHWLDLLWMGLCILLFLPLRLFRRVSSRKTVFLYGHKLHGNLHAIYDRAVTSRSDHGRDLDCFFLTMDTTYYRELASRPNILLALNPLHLFKAVMADCIISDHGLHVLSLLLKFTDITFVDVWHGIPYKGFVPNDFRLQHRYAEIWVSSQLLKQLYVERFGFQEGRVQVTGYARTDLILHYHRDKRLARERLGIDAPKKVILFAPTWKQGDKGRDEIPFGLAREDFFQQLDAFAEVQGAIFIIRFHLNTALADHLAGRNLLHLPLQAHPNGEELVAISDALITDWSSIAFDIMAIGNPIVFLEVPAPFKNGFSLGPEFRPGDKVTSLQGLLASLTEICNDCSRYQAKHRIDYDRIRDAVYDDTLDGKAAERCIERLDKLLAE